MKYIKFNFMLLLAVLFIFSEGCSSLKKTEKDENSDENYTENLSADRLLTKLEANRRKIKNFEGTGSVYVKTQSLDNEASIRVLISKPDSIYLNILGPFSIDLAKILVDNNNFSFYDALQNTVYQGKINKNILKNIFKINLSFDDLIEAFGGTVNLTSRLYKQPDEHKLVGTNYYITYIEENKNKVTYAVNAKTLNIEEIKIVNESNEEIFSCKYSNFSEIFGISIPFTIELNSVQDNQQLILTYKKIYLNSPNFEIEFKPASDAQIIEW